MTELVCCTSKNSVGCTFLDWSINYLKGASKFFNRKLGWIDLVSDPLNSTNAHSHRKNHPNGFLETCEYVDFMQKNLDFATLYPFPISFYSAASVLNQSLINIDKNAWQEVVRYRDHDYNQMLHWLEKQGAKIVFVSTSKSLPLYVTSEFRSLERLIHHNNKPTSIEEVRQSNDIVFFQDSVNEWSNLGLTNVWDTRERLALSTRPFDVLEENVDFAIQHYWIDSQELWFNGDKKIPEILDWLEIKINPLKFDQWLSVYHKWRNLQSNTLSFQVNYLHIIEAIVNGWSYPIDLTFDQEVVIQHCLIYQHGLNLKTWNLTKFPNNTKDLHCLLEPNIHPVEKIY
jgi:hypothetical protein